MVADDQVKVGQEWVKRGHWTRLDRPREPGAWATRSQDQVRQDQQRAGWGQEQVKWGSAWVKVKCGRYGSRP